MSFDARDRETLVDKISKQLVYEYKKKIREKKAQNENGQLGSL